MNDINNTLNNSLKQEIVVNKFDEESAQHFREALLLRQHLDPRKPILVYIDSYGGNADALVKMLETMDEVQNTIITVCMGKAMSAAAILLSYGDIRFCGKHSRVMIHEVSSGTIGHINDMQIDLSETIRLNKLLMDILAKKCGYKNFSDMKSKNLPCFMGQDIYMSAEEAMKFGLVDVVGLPRVGADVDYFIGKASDKPPFKPISKEPEKQQELEIKTKAKVKTKKNKSK